MIPAFLLGPAARYGAIGLVVVAVFGFGFKKGLDWRAGRLEAARAKAVALESRAAAAERDYNALRREVAAAMAAARDRAIEQEKQHAEAAAQISRDADRRIAGVLDHTRRMLRAVTPADGPVRPRPVPEGCPTRQLDDPAVERALVGRAGECAAAEERLRALQQFERKRQELAPKDVD